METCRNYVGGAWVDSHAPESLDVTNPATGRVIGRVPLGTAAEVDAAVAAAAAAFPAWRETPPTQRVQPLFRLKELLERHFEDLSRQVTLEHGKTLDESRGSVRRAIENVEVACGIPSMMMGYGLEDVARGIDCEAFRQPLGVFACIAPFNFPAMVPAWFWPFAVACGNSYVVKPSEACPLSQQRFFELIDAAGFPPGVMNLVNGGRAASGAILEHPGIAGVSFVGSTPVARHVYERCGATGKRVQALGGAKNLMLVMPDAVLERSAAALCDSAFGCAGERCLACSVVVAVGDVHDRLVDALVARARAIRVGDGTQPGVELGPVVSRRSLDRVLGYVEAGVREGARLVLDGRGVQVPGGEGGFWLGPTIFADVRPDMAIYREEIFGPVLAVARARDFDEAVEMVRASPFGNSTAIFTQSGKAAREFKYRVHPSMLGVNVGVAAPMAFFVFGGSRQSFFGDLKGHGRDAIDFFTDKKVVISRWF